jgi:hypothetical protein
MNDYTAATLGDINFSGRIGDENAPWSAPLRVVTRAGDIHDGEVSWDPEDQVLRVVMQAGAPWPGAWVLAPSIQDALSRMRQGMQFSGEDAFPIKRLAESLRQALGISDYEMES